MNSIYKLIIIFSLAISFSYSMNAASISAQTETRDILNEMNIILRSVNRYEDLLKNEQTVEALVELISIYFSGQKYLYKSSIRQTLTTVIPQFIARYPEIENELLKPSGQKTVKVYIPEKSYNLEPINLLRINKAISDFVSQSSSSKYDQAPISRDEAISGFDSALKVLKKKNQQFHDLQKTNSFTFYKQLLDKDFYTSARIFIIKAFADRYGGYLDQSIIRISEGGADANYLSLIYDQEIQKEFYKYLSRYGLSEALGKKILALFPSFKEVIKREDLFPKTFTTNARGETSIENNLNSGIYKIRPYPAKFLGAFFKVCASECIGSKAVRILIPFIDTAEMYSIESANGSASRNLGYITETVWVNTQDHSIVYTPEIYSYNSLFFKKFKADKKASSLLNEWLHGMPYRIRVFSPGGDATGASFQTGLLENTGHAIITPLGKNASYSLYANNEKNLLPANERYTSYSHANYGPGFVMPFRNGHLNVQGNIENVDVFQITPAYPSVQVTPQQCLNIFN